MNAEIDNFIDKLLSGKKSKKKKVYLINYLLDQMQRNLVMPLQCPI